MACIGLCGFEKSTQKARKLKKETSDLEASF